MVWVFVIVVLLVVLLPGFWVKRVLQKYSEPADRYRGKGSGGELARHLLDRFELGSIGVEPTERGDHYDPVAGVVRLSPQHYGGHSLAAVTVATHEVGHAIQHARSEPLFGFRQRIVRLAAGGERVGSVLLIASPLVVLLTRVPQAGLAMLLVAVVTMALGTLAHLVTLPVEIDASFNKALPILKEGDYLHAGDLPHARRILKAAAFTYVAGSLSSLLNLGRWLAVLRR